MPSLVLAFTFTCLLLATAATAVAAISHTADYVIVGAGTCGLLLANRLSSNPRTSVVLIEAGPDDRNNPNVTDPLIWVQTQYTAIDWAYRSTPQPGANNRSFDFHAGKLVGGTSMINGMTYIRADAAEIDAWDTLGATGWNWNALWPYYKRVEQFVPPTEAQINAGASYSPSFHGDNGDLQVGFPFGLLNGSFEGAVAARWEAMGQFVIPDPNGGSVEGYSVFPWTFDRKANTRESAAKAFYYSVDKRPNLKIIRGTATKVLWSQQLGKTQVASGVQYLDQDIRLQSVRLRQMGEVILSAGALRTPPILEASGIGNPIHLNKLGIEVKIDLPGVGENLQDQPNSGLGYTARTDYSGIAPYGTFVTAQQMFGDRKTSISESVRDSLRPWAKKTASVGGGISTSAIEQIFTIQHDLIFNKNVTLAEILTTALSSIATTVFWVLLPFSRGNVHLRSTHQNDIDNPIIDPQYFQIDFDLDCQIAAGLLAHKFWEETPARELVVNASSPTAQTLPSNATYQQWASFIKGSFLSNSHSIGTAAMMSRELGGVVDPKLKVYDTHNLRVVDASVMPLQVSGHLTSTLYAIAERAAEMIVEDLERA